MPNTIKILEPDLSRLERNWGWVLGLGVFFLILGFIGLGMLVGLTLVSMFFFGALLIVAGLMHVIDVFQHKRWKAMLGHAFIAALYLAGGCVVLYDPFLASTILTALLASMLMIIGITRILMAFTLKHVSGWGWLFFAGICALVLGLLIMIQWPISGLWVIGLFIAIELIVNGWSYVFIALVLRQPPKKTH